MNENNQPLCIHTTTRTNINLLNLVKVVAIKDELNNYYNGLASQLIL